MNLSAFTDWANSNPFSIAVLAVLVAGGIFVLRAVRRASGKTPGAVVVSAFGAAVCTAYSGDTSWNFARDHLAMHSAGERGVMFGAGELALFSMALMARQNLSTQGTPGTPGVLAWVITGVQVIPAFSESGLVGGVVRAFVGPVLAGLLWHLAMGIELRHAKPGADSQSLPAVLVRELRERLLSRFGLAQRGRDAEQITRDRWTRISVRRAAALASLKASTEPSARRLARAHRRLAVAVERTDAGVLPQQRGVLLERLAAYRNAGSLASMTLAAPWEKAADPTAAGIESLEMFDAKENVKYAYSEPIVGGEKGELEAVGSLASETGRSRPGVHTKYVPGEEPSDDSPLPPGLDNLTQRARGDFLAVLMDGATPSIRDLKDRYAIGQDRASRIQGELKRALA